MHFFPFFSMVSVKRSPTVAPSVVPRLLAKSAAAAEIVASEVEAVVVGGAVVESPSKRKLRMSVSCDNYLGDGKFSLCRRDSVGSGSPHSSKVKYKFIDTLFLNVLLFISFFFIKICVKSP